MPHESHGGHERKKTSFEIIIPPSEAQIYQAIEMATRSIAHSEAFHTPGPVSYEDFKEHIIVSLTRMRFRKDIAGKSVLHFLRIRSIDDIKQYFRTKDDMETWCTLSRVAEKVNTSLHKD